MTDQNHLLAGKTILQALPALKSGGLERGTVEMARAITQAGGTALVVSAGGQMVRDVERAGGRHITLDISKKGPLAIRSNAKQLAKILQDEGVNLVHARSRAPAWVVKAAAAKTGIPWLATWHGTHLGNALKRRYNRALVEGEKVIAISRYVESVIRDQFPDLADDRIIHIPRGVDLEQFQPETIPGGRIIKLAGDWQLPDGRPLLLMPGRLSAKKGQLDVIEAMAKVRDALDETFVCVIIGDDQGNVKYRQSLEDRIEKLKLWPVMRLAGHCNDMAAALKLADIVLAPTRAPEPFGRIPLEAGAMQALTIAADHGGFRETIIDGTTGYLFKPCDIDDLAAKTITALGLSDEARHTLATQAQTHIRDNFALTLMTGRTIAIYQEVLKSV